MSKRMPKLVWLMPVLSIMSATPAFADGAIKQTKGDFEDKFRQLEEVLPTPNVYRNAAGEPGHQYWQQQVDYDIDVTLDEEKRRIDASEEIVYHNNAPDTLKYLWIQLDQNKFRDDSMSALTTTFGGIGNRGPATSAASGSSPAKLSMGAIRRQQFVDDNELGYQIKKVTDGRGKPLHYVIVGTLMRVDLAEPLKPGKKTELNIDFGYNIVEEDAVSARSGYEHFPDDEREGGNDIFLLAQWFPRLAAYTDYEAWTNKEFIGRGEFTLEFGDYEVSMTVPADHIVSSTGVLQNPRDVLTSEQRDRLEEAEDADRPVFIVTPEEALENEKEGTSDTKTWHFKADNVRDFAWASSRKFMWDAKGVKQGGPQKHVMAMSFWPKEGGDLWKKYSTESIVHTLEVYNRFTFNYPYPTAQSVNGPVGGMEYPMITFNGPRTELQDDGSRTYSLAEKRFLIGVVIHEIGHNYFPMIVNSDERQWTWMDEGLNSFLQFLAESEWEDDYPSRRGEPEKMVPYMISDRQVPIMTNSESIFQFGNNAYGKPATALNILRETIMGRELFDHAFREYAQRWKFKRPTPADFFRSMEDASAVDLDWFWRGWFYGTGHVDVGIESVKLYQIDSRNPDIEKPWQRAQEEERETGITRQRNEGIQTLVERNPELEDFYSNYDEYAVTPWDYAQYEALQEKLTERELALLSEKANFYAVTFVNKGGLVTPLPLRIEYADGESEELLIPAEIWRRDADRVTKVFVREREITGISFDPQRRTADANELDNHWPPRVTSSRFQLFKESEDPNPMRRYDEEQWKQPIQ